MPRNIVDFFGTFIKSEKIVTSCETFQHKTEIISKVGDIFTFYGIVNWPVEFQEFTGVGNVINISWI